MRELKELINRRIALIEDKSQSLKEENDLESEELEKLKSKLEETKTKKNTLSLALTDLKNKLDILEKFYYSVDKLEKIEDTAESITKDDLENIDKIDSILDGVRDKWKVDVQLARYYLMHRESIEEKGLKLAIDKVHMIYAEIKRHENKLHEDISQIEKGTKIASKTIREYRKRIKELGENATKRQEEINEKQVTIESFKSINPYEIITLNSKYLEKLRKLFDTDFDYLEFLKEIVKNNSVLLKTNPKLEMLLTSIKDRLDNASSFEEKEHLSELYMALIYCKNGRDKDGTILAHLEKKDYEMSDDDERIFLNLINIDADEALKENKIKISKLLSSLAKLSLISVRD